jgi:iron-sulfur cluster repair protein YtfE (RIC family)
MGESCGCGCGQADRTLTIAQPGHYGGDERVGDVARAEGALAVLERFGLNHCCGAHLTLREGAAAAGADLTELLRALERAAGRPA